MVGLSSRPSALLVAGTPEIQYNLGAGMWTAELVGGQAVELVRNSNTSQATAFLSLLQSVLTFSTVAATTS